MLFDLRTVSAKFPVVLLFGISWSNKLQSLKSLTTAALYSGGASNKSSCFSHVRSSEIDVIQSAWVSDAFGVQSSMALQVWHNGRLFRELKPSKELLDDPVQLGLRIRELIDSIGSLEPAPSPTREGDVILDLLSAPVPVSLDEAIDVRKRIDQFEAIVGAGEMRDTSAAALRLVAACRLRLARRVGLWTGGDQAFAPLPGPLESAVDSLMRGDHREALDSLGAAYLAELESPVPPAGLTLEEAAQRAQNHWRARISHRARLVWSETGRPALHLLVWSLQSLGPLHPETTRALARLNLTQGELCLLARRKGLGRRRGGKPRMFNNGKWEWQGSHWSLPNPKRIGSGYEADIYQGWDKSG